MEQNRNEFLIQDEQGGALLPVILDFLLIVADVKVSKLLCQSSRQHLIYTSIQSRVESWGGGGIEWGKHNKCSSKRRRKQIKKTVIPCCTEAPAYTSISGFINKYNRKTKSVQSLPLTVHVSMQPEDARVWVSQRPP